jgi:hypothetical protein
MNDLLKREFSLIKKILNNKEEKENCMNLKGFDGRVGLDELYELRELIDNTLNEYTGGSSFEGNGVNFNFTWKDKPFMMRIELDEFHYKIWEEYGIIKTKK